MDEDSEAWEEPGDDRSIEATARLGEAISNTVGYHIDEYRLTAAAVVGALVIEAVKRTIDALEQAKEEDE